MTVVTDAIRYLTDADEYLQELGPLQDAHDKATEELAQAEQSLRETKKDLTDAQSGLALVHIKNLRDYEESIFAKAQQLKDLEGKISAAQTNLDTLKVEVASASAQHQQIEDSIASLRKQHFG